MRTFRRIASFLLALLMLSGLTLGMISCNNGRTESETKAPDEDKQ